MDIEAVRQALYTWMQRETGLPPDRVIFPEQAQHRPPLPYGTLKFLNPSQRVGAIDEIRVDGDEFTTAGLRTATVSINIFGKGANDKMSTLRDSIDRPDVVDEFNEAGLAVIGEEGPTDLTGYMETRYQERSQMDVMIQYAQTRSTAVFPIEEVVIENEDTGETLVVEAPEEEP